METLVKIRSAIVGNVPGSLLAFMEEAQVWYEVIWHKRDTAAERTAVDTDTPRLQFAKTVVVRADDQDVLLVLPAHHRVNTDRVAEALGARTVHLVSETRLAQLFPDSELGAEPPFGTRYRLPVLVAAPMAVDDYITFNAGSHESAIRMRYADYERIERPRVVNFSVKA